jgi:ketosteroid isomerase-like protein
MVFFVRGAGRFDGIWISGPQTLEELMPRKLRSGWILCAGFVVAISLAMTINAYVPADDSAEAQIRSVLEMQSAAWNRGDIDAFMEGYWRSPEVEFVGASGITRGWQAVHDRYRRNYPDGKAMGKLSFSNLEVHVDCPDGAFAIGNFQLEREKDRPSGVFTLNFRKFKEGWRVVADHTTGFTSPASAASH